MGSDKRKKQRMDKLARKETAMNQPGFKSKYALRQKARLRGEPMAARGGENSPWWMKADHL